MPSAPQPQGTAERPDQQLLPPAPLLSSSIISSGYMDRRFRTARFTARKSYCRKDNFSAEDNTHSVAKISITKSRKLKTYFVLTEFKLVTSPSFLPFSFLPLVHIRYFHRNSILHFPV